VKNGLDFYLNLDAFFHFFQHSLTNEGEFISQLLSLKSEVIPYHTGLN